MVKYIKEDFEKRIKSSSASKGKLRKLYCGTSVVIMMFFRMDCILPDRKDMYICSFKSYNDSFNSNIYATVYRPERCR